MRAARRGAARWQSRALRGPPRRALIDCARFLRESSPRACIAPRAPLSTTPAPHHLPTPPVGGQVVVVVVVVAVGAGVGAVIVVVVVVGLVGVVVVLVRVVAVVVVVIVEVVAVVVALVLVME